MNYIYNRPGLAGMTLLFLTMAVFAQEAKKETLVNMQTIPMDGVETLVIKSQAEFLVLLKSGNDSVVLKEYRDDSREDGNQTAYTPPLTSIVNNVFDSGFDVTIKSTTRSMQPQTGDFMEVYIPASYKGNFQLTAEGGIIHSKTDVDVAGQVDIVIANGDLELRRISGGRINISMSEGSFKAEKLTGAEINVRHTSGSIEIGAAQGLLSIEALSGPITVRELDGGGSIATQTGSIDVGLRNVTNDFSCVLTMGSVNITTPPDMSCNISAEAQNGTVTVTPYGGKSPISAQSFFMRRPISRGPDITITAKVLAGSITIGPGVNR
ncbi:MAG: DUF4097 domain-containing protein [Treponema sp.]|jgi:hypothetical protein|nr:DUF4097 domain-containing protein [Treponema sp.]